MKHGEKDHCAVAGIVILFTSATAGEPGYDEQV